MAMIHTAIFIPGGHQIVVRVAAARRQHHEHGHSVADRRPDHASITTTLTHGAGADMDTPFMDFFAEGLAVAGFRSVRFEFPYMVGFGQARQNMASRRSSKFW
jgi:hypothetical protein